MIYRLLDVSDIPKVVDAVEEMVSSSIYAERAPANRGQISAMARSMLANPDKYAIFVCERDGRVVGFIAGCLDQEVFSTSKRLTDYAIFVSKDYRDMALGRLLLLELEVWARHNGAKYSLMGAVAGIDNEAAGRFFDAAGYRPVGSIYMKDF